MIERYNCGIVYPRDIKIEKHPDAKTVNLPFIQKVPYKALRFCQSELEKIFTEIGNTQVKQIFVIGLLKQGKINFDDPFFLYTNSDCKTEYPHIKKDDEVCSEEYCAEILLPFCDAYFPKVEVTQFLANEKSLEIEKFIDFLKEENPSSIIFISDF